MLFESYERRIGQITPVLEKYGMKTLEEANELCLSKGIDVASIVRGIQPICFENACWVVVKAATKKNPAPLYVAGFKYRLLLGLYNILPTRLAVWLVGKVY